MTGGTTEKPDRSEQQLFRVKVGEDGRIVLPAALRKRLGVVPGDLLTVEALPNGLRVQTLAQTVKMVQDAVLAIVPADVSLVDELIAERRAESERE